MNSRFALTHLAVLSFPNPALLLRGAAALDSNRVRISRIMVISRGCEPAVPPRTIFIPNWSHKARTGSNLNAQFLGELFTNLGYNK
jgi:hypothetical protein